MNNNNIEELFNTLEHHFDIENPDTNHKQRFLNKLNNKGALQLVKTNKQRRRLLAPLISVAASIVLLITFIIGFQQESNTRDLANVSPKMAETQNFFMSTINEELVKLKEESLPEVQNIIQDALQQITLLEKSYEALKKDLHDSEDDKRVIYAMISNYQSRIEILQNTLEQIEHVKQLKNSSYETNTTI